MNGAQANASWFTSLLHHRGYNVAWDGENFLINLKGAVVITVHPHEVRAPGKQPRIDLVVTKIDVIQPVMAFHLGRAFAEIEQLWLLTMSVPRLPTQPLRQPSQVFELDQHQIEQLQRAQPPIAKPVYPK